MIKGIGWRLIRVLLILVMAVGMFLTVFGIIGLVAKENGSKGMLIAGIIIIVIATAINKTVLKKLDNVKTQNRQTCRKCGGSMIGAGYSYNGNFKIEKDNNGRYVQHAITVTCPNCGKRKIIVESVPYFDGESADDIKRKLDELLESYYG